MTNLLFRREKTTTSLIRWSMFVTSLISCATLWGSYMRTNWRTPIWSRRTFCSWILISQRHSMQERWDDELTIDFVTLNLIAFFLRIAKFVGLKIPTFVWLISAALPLTMNTTAPSFQHVTTVHRKLSWSLVGHSLVTCGRSVASCLSFIWASRSSKHMTIVNTWLWWKGFLAQFHTGWRGKNYFRRCSQQFRWNFNSQKIQNKVFLSWKVGLGWEVVSWTIRSWSLQTASPLRHVWDSWSLATLRLDSSNARLRSSDAYLFR